MDREERFRLSHSSEKSECLLGSKACAAQIEVE